MNPKELCLATQVAKPSTIDRDKHALWAMLANMVLRGGKDTDLALYAVHELYLRNYDVRSCPPAVSAIIKRAFD